MSMLRDPLDAFRFQSYDVLEIPAGSDPEEYYRLLTEIYEPLGFLSEDILPTSESRRYQVLYQGRVIAIFRITEVSDSDSPYFSLVPKAAGKRLAEVNNVIVAAAFRGTILLGYLMYCAANIANENGFDYVVGITRHQTLRFFVDFGVVPVDHPPLHLLGKAHLLDFAIYYDTRSESSMAYMHERARRFFHQQYVLKSIHEKYVRPASELRAPTAIDVPLDSGWAPA